MSSLGEALPKELARCRELLVAYRGIPNGTIAANLLEADIQAADQAMISGDVVAMIQVYERLKGAN